MGKTIVDTVVRQLQIERARLQSELSRVSAALTAFGKAYMKGASSKSYKTRTISAAGRKRIAEAQRARWAKIRATKKS